MDHRVEVELIYNICHVHLENRIPGTNTRGVEAQLDAPESNKPGQYDGICIAPFSRFRTHATSRIGKVNDTEGWKGWVGHGFGAFQPGLRGGG